MIRLLPLTLVGCALMLPQPVAEPTRDLAVPGRLTVCPVAPGMPRAAPEEPPAPRTVEALRAWAVALEEEIAIRDDLLERAIAARNECRKRLGELNDLIQE